MIEQSSLRDRYTSAGNHSGYELDLKHNGLNEVKHLFARDTDILEGKIHNQIVSWEKKWDLHIDRQEKEKEKLEKIAKTEQADEKTRIAQKNLKSIKEILNHTLSVNDAIDWNSLKNTAAYKETPDKHNFIKFSKKNGIPEEIDKISLPEEPEKSLFFKPVSFWQWLLDNKQKILSLQQEKYSIALRDWEEKTNTIERQNNEREKTLRDSITSWVKREGLYSTKNKSYNNKIDKLKEEYNKHNDEAIEEYCEIVLNSSEYPASFPKDFDLQYNPENNMLLIDYILPNLDDIPCLNIIKYVKSRDAFTECQY